MLRRSGFAFVLFALALSSPQAQAPLQFAIPGRSNANVSLASMGTFAAVAWSASLPDGTTDIYAALSRDSGVSFSTPVRVNSTPGDASVNGEQPPRIVLAQGASALPEVTVVWTSKAEKGTTLLFARSTDAGRAFGKSALIPGSNAAGNRGWENVAVDATGRVRVVWLDHRELAVPEGDGGPNHAGHDQTAAAQRDGVAMAARSKLHVATIGEAESGKAVTGGVCYCCKTAILAGPDGSVYLAWRHVYPGNMRDIAFTVSRLGQPFEAPFRVSQDQWSIDGCPDDGPAMALENGRRIHIAWPTLVTDGNGAPPTIGIFYAASVDGRLFSRRERLATQGLAHHPQVAVSNDRLFVAWDELQQGQRRVVLAERPLGGASGAFTRRIVNGTEPGLYPALSATARGALIAWTSGTGSSAVIRLARSY